MKKNTGNQALLKSQQGATLISTLTFLILMTVVSVSAMKVSITDILVAGNDQQRGLAYVTAETGLEQNTTRYAVLKSSPDPDNSHNDLKTKTTIKNLGLSDCLGVYGQANSIGPTVPKCRVFNIDVTGYKPGSSIADTHLKSVGWEVPNQNQ